MKRLALIMAAICAAIAVNGQTVPYSKYLDYSRSEFKQSHFKYDNKTNTWILNKIDGLNATINILAIISDSEEDVRPDVDDYSIIVHMSREDQGAIVNIEFYSDETYHKLLTFMKDNGEKLIETSSGKIIKHQAYCDGYALELTMEQHIISRTSARTADSKTVKNVDESYNEYSFVIRTDVEPWSAYLEKEAEKQAKRDAKGKKRQSVDDLM